MSQTIACDVQFAPRRLGHANLFVGLLERSMEFYNRICGLEEVRREPGIGAGFLSNGNTHHDLGLMQIGEQPRVGLRGHVQIPKGRGSRAGLNHLGWEVETEKRLVAAYERARAAGIRIHRTTNHQLSHSVYVFDPDGNLNEFYADVIKDWRTIFNPGREDLVSGPWDPDAGTASGEPNYNPRPELARVADAVFHPVRITHAVLVARDFERMRAFYTDVAGLQPVHEGPGGAFVCLRGTSSRYDLALFRAGDGLSPGLHHMAFEVTDERELDEARALLGRAGIEPEVAISNRAKQSLFFRDPDGLGVEMYAPRSGDGGIALAGPNEAGLQPYLV
jgi:catechol 2,3-dioxygenase